MQTKSTKHIEDQDQEAEDTNPGISWNPGTHIYWNLGRVRTNHSSKPNHEKSSDELNCTNQSVMALIRKISLTNVENAETKQKTDLSKSTFQTKSLQRCDERRCTKILF